MKNMLFSLTALTLLMWGCNQAGSSSLTEDSVREFAISQIENQVGYDDAVEGFLAGLSDDLVIWSNPVWQNTPRKSSFDNMDGSGFYEDSIQVVLHDVYMMGDYANVMGTIKWYIAGVNTTYRNFSGIITANDDKQLQWSRWVGIDNSELAWGFLWPSNTIEGGLQPYNEMRNAMMNLNNVRAKELSDSLVEADPSWATAHLGQLHYYWMTNDKENLQVTYDAAVSKLGDASRAEKHFILSYTKDRDVANDHLEQALIFAPIDPMVRAWYAWGEVDADRAIDIMEHAWERLPEHGGVNNMIAYKYMAAGNMEKAKQHFEIFARVHPDVPNAFDSYGDYYEKAGDLEKAKEMYMKAYELDNTWTASKEKAEAL
jgi:tetratricopeptide (TPR) repeat protein